MMKRRPCLFFLLVLSFASMAINPASAETLYGLTGGGSFISIDPSTGAGTFLFTIGYSGCESLVEHSDGSLLAIVRTNDLARIDPVSGQVTIIGDVAGYPYVEALASHNGVLYGTASENPYDVAAERLIQIDVNTAVPTEIGLFGGYFADMEGLASSSSGVLYGADLSYSRLAIISKDTGLATELFRLYIGGPRTLDFSSSDQLYAADQARLWTIDTATGQTTLLGSIGFDDIVGIAFIRAGCTDLDADGYGDPASELCPQPELDCDDANPSIYPGAPEL